MARLTVRTVTESAVQPINNPAELAAFAEKYQLRTDWHEPDESDVDARVYGEQLDNAMGAGWILNSERDGELNVVLRVSGKDTAVVNLANLLAWAAQSAPAKVVVPDVPAVEPATEPTA